MGVRRPASELTLMLSISLPLHGVGHADYYLRLTQKDYYLAEGNEPGQWFGRGAEKLGLRGEVESQVFEHLLWGRSPDGRQALVQNAGDPDRQTAWDLTFSAPKSVSVVWSQAGEAVRDEIVAGHQRAVETALNFVEETTGLTRRGQGGQRMESADLTFATFLHYSSRALDPLVHTHALLINLAVRRDGTTGALWSEEFFRAKLAAGAVYQVQLAAELRQRLGLVTKPARIGFQLAGVSREVCRAFSQRRQKIEGKLAEVGRQDAQTAKWATLGTRPPKAAVSREELLAAWRSRGAQHGWNEARVNDLLHRGQTKSCAAQSLEQEFQERTAELPPEKRTRGRLCGLAAAAAVEQGADAKRFRPLLALLPPARTESQANQKPQRNQTHSPEPSTRRVPPTQAFEPIASSSRPADKQSTSSSKTPAGSGRDKSGQPSHASRPAEEKSGAGQQAKAETSHGGARTETNRSGQEKTSSSQSSANNSSRSKQQRARTAQPGREESRRQNTSQAEAHAGRRQHQQSKRTRQRPHADYEQHREEMADLLRDLDPRLVTTIQERKKLYRVWRHAMRSGEAAELFATDPFSVSRRQQQQNRHFKHAFEDKLLQIPPAAQTRRQLTFQATKLAVEHQATPRALYEVLRDLRPATERGLVSVEWRRLFPNAPALSPVKYWKAPVIVLGRPAKKWGSLLWRKEILNLELRLQKRFLVPKAPHWSPLHKLSLPALRIRLNKVSSEQTDPLAESKKTQDKSQGHSY